MIIFREYLSLVDIVQLGFYLGQGGLKMLFLSIIRYIFIILYVKN